MHGSFSSYLACNHQERSKQQNGGESLSKPSTTSEWQIEADLPPKHPDDVGDEEDQANEGREAVSIFFLLDLEALNDVAETRTHDHPYTSFLSDGNDTYLHRKSG